MVRVPEREVAIKSSPRLWPHATGRIGGTEALRVPLQNYLQGRDVKVYSFVAGVPFSPIDIDIGHLSRGEWNALTDRFRIWYMPGEEGKWDTQLCYVMVRKLDPHDGVLVYAHLMVNLRGNGGGEDGRNFIVGVLSNDDVRARTAINAMLQIPPVFHRRAELEPIERKWRSDPDAVLRFTANVHSATALAASNGPAYELKFELPAGITEQFRQNMGAWWHNPTGANNEGHPKPSGEESDDVHSEIRGAR